MCQKWWDFESERFGWAHKPLKQGKLIVSKVWVRLLSSRASITMILPKLLVGKRKPHWWYATLIFPAVILKLLSNHDLSHTATRPAKKPMASPSSCKRQNKVGGNFKKGAQWVNVLVSSMWWLRVCMCVWKCAEVGGCLRVCVLDEFSEYLLETRVNTSADLVKWTFY